MGGWIEKLLTAGMSKPVRRLVLFSFMALVLLGLALLCFTDYFGI